MVKFIYKCIPVPIFYTNNIKKIHAGCSNGPIIKIRPEYKNDIGLLEHELEHVRQFWKWNFIGLLLMLTSVIIGFITNTFLYFILGYFFLLIGLIGHSITYLFIDSYRLYCEIQCYKIQAKYYEDNRLPLFVKFIMLNYNLNVSKDEILNMINNK